jgi:hypothetical protein
MAPFWPGIGKQQMELRNPIRCDEMLYRVSCVHAQDANVGKCEFRHFATDTSNTTGQPFNAQIIALWVRCRQSGQERSIAATQIDRQWRSANEDLREIERQRDRGGHELNRRFMIAQCIPSPHLD